MKIHTLVIVGGGRPAPALLKVGWAQPQQVVTLMPQGGNDKVAHQVRTLHPRIAVKVGPKLPLGDPQKAVEVMRKVIEACPKPILVSVTGAPLPLSVAAITVCREHSIPALYLDTAAGRILDLAQMQLRELSYFKPSVDQYLRACGVEPDPEPPSPPTGHYKIAALLGKGGVTAEKLLRQIKAYYSHRGPAPTAIPNLHDPGVQRLLQGGWLELYAEHCARDLRDSQGQPVFTAVRNGVRFQHPDGAVREVDLIVLKGAAPLIASCKTCSRISTEEPTLTGQSISKNQRSWLDELKAVASALGQEYCPSLLIHNARNVTDAFLHQARLLGIVVVGAPQLPELGNILAREMLTPTYGRR